MSRSAANRREFFRSTAALAAAGAVVPYWLTGENVRADQAKSKNDRLRIGAIGVGGRGSGIASWAAKFGDVVAVCDADLGHAERAKNDPSLGKGKADVYQDYRKLLDRKDIDVVTNGTPDHWHTAVNIAACRSGRDVYAEKPLTLTIDEGKRLCKVVEETGRIVQVGTMQRSDKNFQTAVELVRNGRIGKLKQVWVALPYYTTKGGPFAKQPVPARGDPVRVTALLRGQRLDKAGCFELGQRPVQSAWPHGHPGKALDVLDEGVAVLGPSRQTGEHQEAPVR